MYRYITYTSHIHSKFFSHVYSIPPKPIQIIFTCSTNCDSSFEHVRHVLTNSKLSKYVYMKRCSWNIVTYE